MIQDRINFNIDNVDGLGQGVFRGEKVTFIEKTLPGESGTAIVYREAKGVRFAFPEKVTRKSSLRIIPECSVFSICSGCQYLHTEYSNEIKLKKEYLKQLMEPLFKGEITSYPAPERFYYRNRIQLHYNLKSGELGFISKFSDKLVSASECRLPVKPVMETVKKLYFRDRWKDLIPENDPEKGTIEIYLKSSKSAPIISVNKPYSSGGFSQVNRKMNKILQNLAEEEYNNFTSEKVKPLVLDIFGGDGNLTGGFKDARVIIVDIAGIKHKGRNANISKDLKVLDLYRKNSIEKLEKYVKTKFNTKTDIIVFDPPRKGVRYVREWAGTFNPEVILYVSCNPETFKRDTQNLADKYLIKKLYLIDLFPGTRHFETLGVFIKRGIDA